MAHARSNEMENPLASYVGKDICLPARCLRPSTTYHFGWACKQIDEVTLLQDAEYFISHVVRGGAIGCRSSLVSGVTAYLNSAKEYFMSRGIAIATDPEDNSDEKKDVVVYFDESQSTTIEEILKIASEVMTAAMLSKQKRRMIPQQNEASQKSSCTFNPIDEVYSLLDILALHCRFARSNQLVDQLITLLVKLEPPTKTSDVPISENKSSLPPSEVFQVAQMPANVFELDTNEMTLEPPLPAGPEQLAPNMPDSYYAELRQNEELTFRVELALPQLVSRIAELLKNSSNNLTSITSCLDEMAKLALEASTLSVTLSSLSEEGDISLPGWNVCPHTEKSIFVAYVSVRLNEDGRVTVCVNESGSSDKKESPSRDKEPGTGK